MPDSSSFMSGVGVKQPQPAQLARNPDRAARHCDRAGIDRDVSGAAHTAR